MARRKLSGVSAYLRYTLEERQSIVIRDREHRGRMALGQCIYCYGWADDPRHWSFDLADGSDRLSAPLGKRSDPKWNL